MDVVFKYPHRKKTKEGKRRGEGWGGERRGGGGVNEQSIFSSH